MNERQAHTHTGPIALPERLKWSTTTRPAGEHIGATWQIRSKMCFFRPTRVHNPNGMSIGSVVFAQVTADCRVTLYFTMGRLSSKIAPSHGYLDSHLILGSLGPTEC